MSELTFGRYSPYNTVVHRIDPRSKIFYMVLLFVAIFLQFTMWSTNLIISGLLLVLMIIVMGISRISFTSLLKSFVSMWFLLIFLLVIYALVPNKAYVHPAFNLGSLTIYYDAFYQWGYIVLRLVMILCTTMVLTSTTKPMDLTNGLEWGMGFLKPIHFPAHEIAMTISIALRFIPTILDETNRIMKAQSSRGVDFNHGILTRVRAIVSLIIPLFVSAIERSEELANAMEARGYDPRMKRTHFHVMRFTYLDWISFFLVLLVFGGVLTLFIIDKNVETVNIIQTLFNIDLGF
ncbi:MAG: energy-coupling factor transporter transmembrane protein EcfT [Bacilli bacterium]|nr:energy-coupling factor transporter transmembrane protein EcfT [Bacilli bacterium]